MRSIARGLWLAPAELVFFGRAKKPNLSSLLILTLIAFCFCMPCFAAQVSADLSGIIADQSGAAVTGAKVTVKSLDTGLARTSLTDQGGRYRFFALPVGLYEIRVAKQGFAEAVRSGIRLAVGQDASADLSLRVGKVTEEVKVDEDVPIVNVTTQDISGLVGETQINDLPLNGRSYDLLLTLNPGVVNFTWEKTGGIGISNSTTGNDFSVSGNRPQQNLFLLNGIEFTGAAENNMQPGGTSGQLLGVDAVREFNVLRDTYGPEYGKHPGGQVNIVTQSGTNELHGSVYEFLRNNALDAPNYFDKGSAPPFQRNQFGVALGGPIQTDKTFIFGNYEGLRQNLHQTSVAFVPDNASRASAVPAVQPLLNLWPQSPTEACDPACGIAEYASSPLQTIREDFGTLRLDHNVSSRDSLSAVYTIDDGDDFTETVADPYSSDIMTLREQVFSLDEAHSFSGSAVNVARVGYSRAGYFFTGEPTPGTPAAGVSGFLSGDPVGAAVVGGSAASNPQAAIGLAGSNNGSNLRVARNLYTFEDRVALTRGRHQLMFGAWFQPFQSNETLALSQYGQATFSSLANFLLGNMTSFLWDPSPTEMNWRSLFGAWYAEDTIRVFPRMTLSLGFRDEFTTGWNEAHGRAANYTFTSGIVSTTPHVGDSLFTINNAKFLPEPRIGLAWSPFSEKTVFRAGFGIYSDLQDALGYRTDQNAPFNPSYSVGSATAPFPVSSLPINPSVAPPTGAKLVPGGIQPDMNTPTLISWSLRVEQEITPDMSLTVGYVGSHGYHEMIGVDANEPFPVICPASPCPATYPATFPAPLAGSPVPAGTYYVPTNVRANPALANTWTWFSLGTSNYNALQVDANRRFRHGFSLRGVYTWSKALDDGDSLNATAAANAPGLVSNPFNLRADYGLATYDVQNAAAINAVYTLPVGKGQALANNVEGWADALVSGWSVNSIVTVQSGFPFTPQLSYNPSNNGDTRNPVRPFVNPDFSGPVILGRPSQWFNPNAFLAPPPNSGFYGNLGRDTLIGPGLATWDFSAFKTTTLHERLALQFRAEIFNLLNRANLNTPNLITFTSSGTTTKTSGTAAAIISTSSSSRQVQFGLKLIW
ncbi:MAG TPA: carboxypeptidase regulatory-like domain-containing protein [Terriglobales bacterium]|nr:carboxypeptidase regulatory-like domain-containing protein [Terriglobales bacterium]